MPNPLDGLTTPPKAFTDLSLESSVIAVPLLRQIAEKGPEAIQSVIIDLNLIYPGGRKEAKKWVIQAVKAILGTPPHGNVPQGIDEVKSEYSEQYLFGDLQGEVLRRLIRRDSASGRKQEGDRVSQQAIYHIWPDFAIEAFISKSISTVKADAARVSFSALGEGIVWAVMDSGIDRNHPHFSQHGNLSLESESPLMHHDFTRMGGGENPGGDKHPDPPLESAHVMGEIKAPYLVDTAPALSAVPGGIDKSASVDMPLPQAVPTSAQEPLAPPIPADDLRRLGVDLSALVDASGHGTHVAGIIAGELAMVETRENPEGKRKVRAFTRVRDEVGNIVTQEKEPGLMTGMAPRCKLLSLKVLDGEGKGKASNLIAAISYIQEMNGHGRRIRIHGVNMSVGYAFEPKWFACGQSPLCVEVDRLVRSGVVVVVAAGNTGYGSLLSEAKGSVQAGMDLTINDPGNAELAITVGSTHRDMPHIYGVSYFSSKGPTGDGRMKPDLVAPGEKILSCAAGRRKQDLRDQIDKEFEYLEESGTSMAAPHVSGVIAAFLSIRREFIGQPEKVKQIFTSTATDLRREKYFQGSGLVDLMRAIQSV